MHDDLIGIVQHGIRENDFGSPLHTGVLLFLTIRIASSLS